MQHISRFDKEWFKKQTIKRLDFEKAVQIANMADAFKEIEKMQHEIAILNNSLMNAKANIAEIDKAIAEKRDAMTNCILIIRNSEASRNISVIGEAVIMNENGEITSIKTQTACRKSDVYKLVKLMAEEYHPFQIVFDGIEPDFGIRDDFDIVIINS